MISAPQKNTYDGFYLLRTAFPLMLSNLAGNGISFFSTFFFSTSWGARVNSWNYISLGIFSYFDRYLGNHVFC